MIDISLVKCDLDRFNIFFAIFLLEPLKKCLVCLYCGAIVHILIHSALMAESIISFIYPSVTVFFTIGSTLVLFSAPFCAALSVTSLSSMYVYYAIVDLKLTLFSAWSADLESVKIFTYLGFNSW